MVDLVFNVVVRYCEGFILGFIYDCILVCCIKDGGEGIF